MKTLKNTVGILAIAMSLFTLNTKAQTSQTQKESKECLRNVQLASLSAQAMSVSTSSVVSVYKSRSVASERNLNVPSTLGADMAIVEEDIPLEDWMLSPFALENGYLMVDAEDDIQLEDWMLTPFTSENEYMKVDAEEEIQLEDWMSDLSTWE